MDSIFAERGIEVDHVAELRGVLGLHDHAEEVLAEREGAQTTLIESVWFIAYFVASIPAARHTAGPAGPWVATLLALRT